MKKRGLAEPSGSSAAAVVGIITLLLVFYILFLPPEERQKLLNDQDDNDLIPGKPSDARVLLLANVGTLSYYGQSKIDHTIPNLLLSETKNAAVLQSFNPFIISKGAFSEQPRINDFVLSDINSLENVKLVFQASRSSGSLTVRLNGVQLYEGHAPQVLEPIVIPASMLRSSNTLEFSVSGPGLAFWVTNSIQISGLQLIGDVKDLSKQSSYNVFTVDKEEKELLNKATLSFFAVCQQQSVSTLQARLNGRVAYNGVPDCDTLNKVEIFPDSIVQGQNTLEFSSTKGNYRLEQIKIQTSLNEPKPFTQYFELNETQYDATQRKSKKLILQIEFVDDNKDKLGEVNINGLVTYIDQKDKLFRRDMTINARSGNNYLQLKPKTTLNIVKLEVRLE